MITLKKFKIGDKVRFKSKEELIKIINFSTWTQRYKSLIGKEVIINYIYSTARCEYYIIQVGDCALEPFFPENYFEEPNLIFLVEA